MRPYIVFPWLSGLLFVLVGVILARRDVMAARGVDKLVAVGSVFVGASLAAFGAEHFTIPQFIQQVIPAWIPARLFFVYFVVRRYVLLAASLLALMFLIFVTAMHVPNAIRAGGRFPWIVALRDLSFGCGALVLAGTWTPGWRLRGSSWMVTLGRVIVAVACLAFGVLHFLYPANAPGVPLRKMTPPWIPLPAMWGYLTGAIELVTGGFMLANRNTRAAAAWLGFVVTILVLVIYMPFVFVAVESNQKLEALNYVWDTLLFAGTVLLVARAEQPRTSPALDRIATEAEGRLDRSLSQ
jgi:uncharacterized membrane protein